MADPRRTSYSPEYYVPEDSYRVQRLPPDIRNEIERLTDTLALDRQHEDELEEDWITHKDSRLQSFADEYGKWYASESERSVVCFGETFAGKPILSPNTGIVVKFNITTRSGDRKYPNPRAVGNLSELQIWKYVVDAEIDEWFGTILDYAADGAWLAMREYIPYFTTAGASHPGDYITRTEAEYPYATILQQCLDEDHGEINPHKKDGNVGLEPLDVDRYKPVSIDYTSHTTVEDLEWTN